MKRTIVTPEGQAEADLTQADIEQRALDETRHIADLAESYKLARIAEYPPIGDQLDAIMKWAAVNVASGPLKEVADACLAVKARHPKPE